MFKNIFFITLVTFFSCHPNKNMNQDILYSNEAFTVYKDKVVQGNNMATVQTPTHISSNYRSPASDNYSRLITFKFSINERDNELPVGVDHQVIIGEEKNRRFLHSAKFLRKSLQTLIPFCHLIIHILFVWICPLS